MEQVNEVILNNNQDLGLNDLRDENQDDLLDKYDPDSEQSDMMIAEDSPQAIDINSLPIEERKQRISLLNALKSYKLSSFKDVLSEYDSAQFVSKSNEELTELLEEFRFLVNIRNSNSFNMSVFQNMSIISETALQKVGLKCAGLTQHLSKNKEIPLLVEEIGLAHQNLTHMRPELKLGLIIFSTASILHQIRSSSDEMKEKINKKINDKIKKEFADI